MIQDDDTDDGAAGSPTGKRRLKDRLDVSEEVLQEAVELYQDVMATVEDVDKETLPIAVLYVAIRRHGVPRSIDEVAEVAAVSPPKLYRTARVACQALDQGIPPADPEIYVTRLVDEFDAPAEAERAALRLLSVAKSEGHHSGRNPEAVAAAALYGGLVETGHESFVSQRELGEHTSVHRRTIRKSYKAMEALAEE